MEQASSLQEGKMTDLKTSLLEFLKSNCRGRDRAWPIDMLAGYFHADEREVRECLRRLNLEGQPVVTLTRKPYGAYFTSSQDDLDAYWRSLNSRVLKTLERMRAVNKIKTKEFVRDQMELFE